MSTRAESGGLMVILGLYFSIGTLYAIKTPAWQVPDEPAHYNYIRQVVERRAVPVLEPGDYDQAYLSELTSTRFPPDKPIETLEYEDHQPPLYYLLAAPIFAASGGDLIALRLFSLALGAGVIVFAFLMAREICAHSRVLPLTAAGFVAFVPQHVAMMAGVNNDALAELWIVAGLWLIVRGTKETEGTWTAPGKLGLGLVMGAAFLTKTTAYLLAPIACLALLLSWRQRLSAESSSVQTEAREAPLRSTLAKYRLGAAGLGGSRLRPTSGDVALLIRNLGIVFLPALLLGALWWGRNVVVYGGTDILGLQRHDGIVVGQPRTVEWMADLGWAEYLRRFLVTTFRSFWGQFGWMGVVMDWRVYLALLAYSLIVLTGCVVALVRHRLGRSSLYASQAEALALLAVVLLLTAALYLYYNLTFVQHQGRYLFPALSVVGLGAAIGTGQWVKWAIASAGLKTQGIRPWVEFALMLMPVGFMAALDVFALYRFIIPDLTLAS